MSEKQKKETGDVGCSSTDKENKAPSSAGKESELVKVKVRSKTGGAHRRCGIAFSEQWTIAQVPTSALERLQADVHLEVKS